MLLLMSTVAAPPLAERPKVDHRLYPREEKRKFRHLGAHQSIVCDCLGPDPLFGKEFELMFRVSRRRMQCLLEDFGNSTIPFYTLKKDCFYNDVPSLEARLLLPLKSLAYGVPPHTFMDYYSMSKTCARDCYMQFAMAMKKLYCSEHLRKPTLEDLKNITSLHKSVHRGVDGILGSLDCMHVYWDKCPVAWQGQFKKGKAKPSIVLEGLADYNLYLWHAGFGTAGTQNDVNVFNLSELCNMILNGELEKLETQLGPFKVMDFVYDFLIILVDGIYPRYNRFIKAHKEPIGDDEKALTSWQESARKDVERAFGVLQAKFQFMARPVVLRDMEQIENQVTCCLILHNMCVSERIMDGDPRARYNPSNTILEEQEKPEDVAYEIEHLELQEKRRRKRSRRNTGPDSAIGARNMPDHATKIVSAKDRWKNLLDKNAHAALHNALKTYLGNQY